MKILILGHSDSDGSRLRDANDGWPWILQRRLKTEAGIDAEVVHRLLFAGPTAVRYMEREVARARPDIVIVATSAYEVVVELASNRVRRRFGERAGTAVNRLERRAARLSAQLGHRGKRAFTAVRGAGRKAIGTEPAFNFEALVDCYTQSLDSLARSEDIRTIIFGGLGYGRELQQLNPKLNDLQDEFHRRLRERAAEHRFAWVVHEEILGGREGKLRFMQPDGVHSNEEAQLLAAAAVLPLVRERL
jgi:lysophospholipase L1-like esterase